MDRKIKRLIYLGLITVMVTASLFSTGVQAAIPNYNCEVQTAIPVEECEALIALYEATDGEQWNVKAGWLSNPDPCTWHGVMCAEGQVATLNLFANNLNGELPLEIGAFPSLRTLTLNDNPLSGVVPLTVTFLDLDLFHFHRTQMCIPVDPAFQDWLSQIIYRLDSGISCRDLTPTAAPSRTPGPTNTQPAGVPSTATLPWPQQTLTALAAEAQTTPIVEATVTKYYSAASASPTKTNTPEPSATAIAVITQDDEDAGPQPEPEVDDPEQGGFISRIPKVWFLLLMIPVALIVFGLYLEFRQRRLDDEPFEEDEEVGEQLFRLDYTDPNDDR